MDIPSVRAAATFRARCAGMAPRVCHHGFTLVSCQEGSSDTARGGTLTGPFEGPHRKRTVKAHHREDDARQTPGTDQLCESPGRAGDGPGCKLAVACRESTAYPVREIVHPLDSLTGGASYAYNV
jgi:hypothetical protein